MGTFGIGAVMAISAGGALAIAGCADDRSPTSGSELSPLATIVKLEGPEIEPERLDVPRPTNLDYWELRVGKGREAKVGDEVTVQLIGRYFDGEPLESSWQLGRPFRFVLGVGRLSPSWETAIAGMLEGGRRQVLIPRRLTSQDGPLRGTGARDAQAYVVELLDVA